MEANQLVNAVPVWVQNFDEWLTGMCHSVETFCRLQEGVLVKMVQDVLLGTARAFKNATMPNLAVNSVSVFGFFIKVAIITVILFIASILSLQEMDELRERRYNSIFRREFSLLGKRLALTGNAWLRTQAVILFLTTCLCILTLIAIGNPYCRHRNRSSGCAANLRNRDGPDSLGDFSDAAAKMVPGGDASGPLSGLLFYERICRSKADGEKNGAVTSGNIDVHVRGPSVIRISGIYSRSGGAYADRRFGGRVLEKWK